MRLTIVNIAYPFAPVSCDSVGGAEQVLATLDAALVQAGHRSIVIAAAGSTVCGELVALPASSAPIDEQRRRRTWQAQRAATDHVLAHCSPHVLHFHGLDFHEYLPASGPPALVTLHLPLNWYPRAALLTHRPHTWFHCVSSEQSADFNPPHFLPCIPNGVRVRHFRFRQRKRRFALSLGRICPEKGFHLAMEAAARAGVPMLLGGDVFPYEEHRRYFQDYIQPRLGPACRFLGPLSLGRKRRLLAAARCVLIPSLARETSSLVAMEALASGTPVVAFPSGALAEIVEHGRTGLLVSSAAEMAQAIAAVETIDPAACRQAARERFSQECMVARYLEVYATLAASAQPALRRDDVIASVPPPLAG